MKEFRVSGKHRVRIRGLHIQSPTRAKVNSSPSNLEPADLLKVAITGEAGLRGPHPIVTVPKLSRLALKSRMRSGSAQWNRSNRSPDLTIKASPS